MVLVNDEQLIKDYLYSNYSVTTARYGNHWMVMDKLNGQELSKINFIIITTNS